MDVVGKSSVFFFSLGGKASQVKLNNPILTKKMRGGWGKVFSIGGHLFFIKSLKQKHLFL